MSVQDDTTLANGIARLEQRLRTASGLATQARAEVEADPTNFARQLSLRSITSHVEELQQDLRQAKEDLGHELIDLRLFAGGLRGSVPLGIAGKIFETLDRAIAFAAHHLRFGVDPQRGVSSELRDELDLRLSGVAAGSTRLLVSGRISPTLTGDSLLSDTLVRVFEMLSTQDREGIRDLVIIVGPRSARELEELLAVFDSEEIGAELTWSAPNARRFTWGGSLSEVRATRARLALVTELKPETVVIVGHIAALTDAGALHLRPAGTTRRLRIRYSQQQYLAVQQLHLGMPLEIEVTKYSYVDDLTGEERSKYSLLQILNPPPIA